MKKRSNGTSRARVIFKVDMSMLKEEGRRIDFTAERKDVS